MNYVSTRGGTKKYSASEAVIRGLADDGGLFVPEYIPSLDIPVSKLTGMSYKKTAYEVMKLFFTDYSEEELMRCIDNAYDSKFDTGVIAPVVKRGDSFYLELFHGRTIAFKDMALSILPHLLTCALHKNNIKDKVLIMTATSGDTGKAALEAFADIEGTKIIVFYPKGGVSRIQEWQMVTQKGANTKVVGVTGNFDDCQSAVKRMFSDPALGEELAARGYRFSSANSINIGRLIPQIVYYVYSYAQMVDRGYIQENDKLNFTVPTGNFGNILAAFYARQIGIPIGKLICASNVNKVLYDFFQTGTYDKNRDFILTSSPSMDILISSNLERLIYHSLGDDAAANAALMNDLAQKGSYTVAGTSGKYLDVFEGIYATEEQVSDTIRSVYESCGYVIDTHTAVAAYADGIYRQKDDTASVIVSTASPYKFMSSVLGAIDAGLVSEDDFAMAEELSKLSKVPVPAAVTKLKDAAILHDTVCTVEGMKEQVRGFI